MNVELTLAHAANDKLTGVITFTVEYAIQELTLARTAIKHGKPHIADQRVDVVLENLRELLKFAAESK